MLNFDPARVKRVLIYRLGSLGDTVVALPALHLVERAFPHARRLMLTNIPIHAKAPPASAVLEGSGLVHGFLSYPVGTRSLRKLSAVWWRIRRFRPHVLIYLMPARGDRSTQRDSNFFRLCGIRNIVGIPYGELGKNLYDPDTSLWELEASRILRCIHQLGLADLNDLRWWDLRLTNDERTKARTVLAQVEGRRLIACGPGTKMQAKDWGKENWRALLRRLGAEMPDHALILVGAREDAAAAACAAADWRGPVLDLCGVLTPRETAAVLRHTELFLGPDSGPMHLAAIGGVSCAIAFAARDEPGKWYPAGEAHRIVYHRVECMGCQIEVCIEKKKKCLASITVDEMFLAAMEAWQSRRTTGI